MCDGSSVCSVFGGAAQVVLFARVGIGLVRRRMCLLVVRRCVVVRVWFVVGAMFASNALMCLRL